MGAARNTYAGATSSGWAGRFIGTSFPNFATFSASWSAGLSGVQTGPGATQFTRIPRSTTFAWDGTRRRFLIAPITGKSVLAWTGPGSVPAPIAEGAGRYDGIEVLDDGRVLLSAWNDSTVSLLRGDRVVPFLRGLPAGADIGVDPKAGVVAVPMLMDDRVEFWSLGEPE